VIAKLVENLGPDEALREFEQTDFYQNLQRKYPASAKSLADLFSNRNTDALVASLRAFPSSAPLDSLNELHGLDVPSLVLGNRNDPVHPFELAQSLAEAIPESRFREFPSKSEDIKGHYHQFRQIVTEFLNTL
jgi:pimeloyl-ACP methyl ester carboxylesterase